MDRPVKDNAWQLSSFLSAARRVMRVSSIFRESLRFKCGQTKGSLTARNDLLSGTLSV